MNITDHTTTRRFACKNKENDIKLSRAIRTKIFRGRTRTTKTGYCKPKQFAVSSKYAPSVLAVIVSMAYFNDINTLRAIFNIVKECFPETYTTMWLKLLEQNTNYSDAQDAFLATAANKNPAALQVIFITIKDCDPYYRYNLSLLLEQLKKLYKWGENSLVRTVLLELLKQKNQKGETVFQYAATKEIEELINKILANAKLDK